MIFISLSRSLSLSHIYYTIGYLHFDQPSDFLFLCVFLSLTTFLWRRAWKFNANSLFISPAASASYPHLPPALPSAAPPSQQPPSSTSLSLALYLFIFDLSASSSNNKANHGHQISPETTPSYPLPSRPSPPPIDVCRPRTINFMARQKHRL